MKVKMPNGVIREISPKELSNGFAKSWRVSKDLPLSIAEKMWRILQASANGEVQYSDLLETGLIEIPTLEKSAPD